jgi:hypothetical protein
MESLLSVFLFFFLSPGCCMAWFGSWLRGDDWFACSLVAVDADAASEKLLERREERETSAAAEQSVKSFLNLLRYQAAAAEG